MRILLLITLLLIASAVAQAQQREPVRNSADAGNVWAMQFIDRIVRGCSAGATPQASVIVNPNSTGNVAITTCTGGSVTINGGAVPTSATGTANTIAKFTSASALGNSRITDDGTNIAVNSGVNITSIGDTANTGNGTKIIIDDAAGITAVGGLISQGAVSVTGGIGATGTISSLSGYEIATIAKFYRVPSAFNTAANTNFQTITGLTWTIPANTTISIPFSCHMNYSQSVGLAAISFGIQDVTVAPTNINAMGQMQISTGPPSTYGDGTMLALTTTTATAIVTQTPGALATSYNTHLYGYIEHPSNASASAIQIMVKTAVAADQVTIQRGGFCQLF